MIQQRDNSKLLREITPRNLLSFGPQSQPLALNSLNVLIGPNGSGKSNLIDLISLVRASPDDIRSVVRLGGGVGEWVWKGAPREPASVEAVISNPLGNQPLRHYISFRAEDQAFALVDERIENEHAYAGRDHPYFYYQYQGGRPVLNVAGTERHLARESVEPDRSILAQRRDPETYPEVSYLADVYAGIRIYREWTFGRNSIFRVPQPANMRNDRLEEDFSNLGLHLNRLERTPATRRDLLSALQDLYEGVDDFRVHVDVGTVQVFLAEGDSTIPATRLSDGTLRYLCLMAILCDPKPPALLCIEEPELGLHPDILPKVADRLIEASEHTQLIVTTHSDILVDALTERPEAIVVCEKHGSQTIMRRLDLEELSHWLEAYRLGDLWTRGEIGGTRW